MEQLTEKEEKLKNKHKEESLKIATRLLKMNIGDTISVIPSDYKMYNRIKMRAYRAGMAVQTDKDGNTLIITKYKKNERQKN